MEHRRIPGLWAAGSAILLGVCFFSGLGSIGLLGPDEPRYASIARAMARTGDWVTPRLWGHPWFEKPILYYWSAAISFRLLGASDFAARLPDAFAALVGALLLGWAAWRIYGPGAGRLTLLLFPTSIGVFAFAHAATMDMLLAVSVEAAMVAALFALQWPANQTDGRTRRGLRLALVGACIGLGTLAKGPVAIILAGGSVLLWAVLTRRWRDALRFLRWESLAAFAVVAVPWYVACSLANPGFAYSFLWYQNVTRFVTPVFEHIQPWWFFIPVLSLGLLPWTPLLLVAAREGWRVFRSGDAPGSPAVFVACWVAFPLLFFSLSDSKLPGYILPALPPLIFLLARTIDRLAARGADGRERDRDRLGEWSVALVGLAWIALAATAGHWLSRLPMSWALAHHAAILTFLVTTGVIGLVIAWLSISGRARQAVVGSALWMGVLIAAVSWFFLPQVNPYLSARSAAQAANNVAGPHAVIETYQLKRDWVYGLNYYFGRELPEWSLSQSGSAWIYTTARALSTVPRDRFALDQTYSLPNGLVLIRVTPHSP